MSNQTEPILWQFTPSKAKSSLCFTQYTIHICGSVDNKLFWNKNSIHSENQKYVMVKDNNTTSPVCVEENSLWIVQPRMRKISGSSTSQPTGLYEINEAKTSNMFNFYTTTRYDENDQVMAMIWTGIDSEQDWRGVDDNKILWKITPTICKRHL